MICSYYRKNYLSDNKDNDPGIFVPSMKEFNKNPFIYGAIYYQVESLNSDFESEIKKAINHYRRDQWTKNFSSKNLFSKYEHVGKKLRFTHIY